MEENKRRRRISTPLLLFLILMGITLALCLTVLGIWLHGRSVLRSKTAEPPAISTDSKQTICARPAKRSPPRNANKNNTHNKTEDMIHTVCNDIRHHIRSV